MTKTLIAVLSVLGALLLAALIMGGTVISTLNNETDLRVAIEAKQRDNTSEFDNMFKTISQSAQVSQGSKQALQDIFTSYAKARSGGNDGTSGGSLANWIKEAVPNVDMHTFNNLQNIIVGHRDSWTMRQKELLDLNREHEGLISRFPSGLICSMFGRKSINIQIITSTRTEKAFETGKDDDTKVF
jgi:hypothetical protein